MNYFIFTLLIAFSSHTFAADSKQSLFEQEQAAQKEVDKLFLNTSYQKICLEKTSQLTKIYTDKSILKGDISRIYFFCESEYNYKLSRRQRRGFEIWDIKDPASIFECKREKQFQSDKVASNPYIINRC